jgi:lysophospholipase L1-like esterase
MTLLSNSARSRALLALLGVAVVAGALGIASAQANAYPSSMAALGDSITQAFNACPAKPLANCPESSWSTGSNGTVDSVYERLLVLNTKIKGNNINDAVSGAKMAELNTQAKAAVTSKVELVTILMGANDACTSSLSTMTSVATYKSEFETAMKTLTSGIPSARIDVGSLPDVYRLWEIFHTNSSATKTWEKYGICQSMLEKPTSLLKADEERRMQVKAREEEFDTALESVCAKYPQCKYDDGAGFKSVFNTNDVSTLDYFHPSEEGQAVIAHIAWEAYMAEDEFDGDSSSLEATSTTTQTFQLGSSDWIECGKLTLKHRSPSASTSLALTVKSYGGCIFNHPSVSEKATPTASSLCEWLLKTFGLTEMRANYFSNGGVDFDCTLSFTTSHCEVKLLPHSFLTEFQWEDVDTTFGSYESELSFDVTHIPYEVTGTGCTTSGSNGEYKGSIPVNGVTVLAGG